MKEYAPLIVFAAVQFAGIALGAWDGYENKTTVESLIHGAWFGAFAGGIAAAITLLFISKTGLAKKAMYKG